MAMTKKEKEEMQKLREQCALHKTGQVFPDVAPPMPGSFRINDLSIGWYVGAGLHGYRVRPACSSSIYHGIGRIDKTDSQGSLFLYSSRLLGLQAARNMIEAEAAILLAEVDAEIAEERGNPSSLEGPEK